ncbi:RDD family protein [Candidatus Poribacteria bacterium]|nr:MAG: RDD family protein [Candidatus Poribacteria bacterium]
MNEQLSIETPEQIDLSFQKAGIGSRFYAALIDTGLLTLIALVGYYVNRNFIMELGETLGNWLGALGGIIVFALFWGYYMVFEVTTNGQSLGKRALGLRVIKEGGYPIGFADSAIRNLVRLADFLPFFYGAGLLAMLINKDWRRLGDLAAGTLVVKTARTDRKLTGANSKAASSINIPPQQTFTYSAWIQPELVTENELGVIREYLGRRAMLPKLRRSELGRTIADPIIERMEGKEEIRKRIVVDYDKFLEEVYALKTSETS